MSSVELYENPFFLTTVCSVGLFLLSVMVNLLYCFSRKNTERVLNELYEVSDRLYNIEEKLDEYDGTYYEDNDTMQYDYSQN